MPIQDSITVTLRLILTKEEMPDQLVADFVEVNRLRNKVIHEARLHVSPEEAHKAIRAMQAFTTILNPRIVDLMTTYLADYHENDHIEQ